MHWYIAFLIVYPSVFQTLICAMVKVSWNVSEPSSRALQNHRHLSFLGTKFTKNFGLWLPELFSAVLNPETMSAANLT